MSIGNFIDILWVAFILYWIVSAIGVKKNIKRARSWWMSFTVRIILIIAVTWAFQWWGISAGWRGNGSFPGGNDLVPGSVAMAVLGLILCIAGFAFAVWARVHLGRNWSGTPSIKEEHELVTSGPYRYVRHPIYTGIAAALLGTALVSGLIALIIFVVFTVVFLFRIPIEERFMMQLFPGQYPEYKKRTKALIPFVW